MLSASLLLQRALLLLIHLILLLHAILAGDSPRNSRFIPAAAASTTSSSASSSLAAAAAIRCAEVEARHGTLRYGPPRLDARSGGAVITRRRLRSSANCEDLAESKRALAFNFATGNLSCIGQVGLFGLVDGERANFTNARTFCAKHYNGTLADVTSDARTRGVASLIGQSLVYVGLSSESKQGVWKNEYDEPLTCFDYRAWDTGEPSHNRGCVGLSQGGQPANVGDPVWRVVSCRTRLPFVCELPRRSWSSQSAACRR